MDIIEYDIPLGAEKHALGFAMLRAWRDETKGYINRKAEILVGALRELEREDLAMIVMPMHRVEIVASEKNGETVTEAIVTAVEDPKEVDVIPEAEEEAEDAADDEWEDMEEDEEEAEENAMIDEGDMYFEDILDEEEDLGDLDADLDAEGDEEGGTTFPAEGDATPEKSKSDAGSSAGLNRRRGSVVTKATKKSKGGHMKGGKGKKSKKKPKGNDHKNMMMNVPKLPMIGARA